jgi:hypothetical protein
MGELNEEEDRFRMLGRLGCVRIRVLRLFPSLRRFRLVVLFLVLGSKGGIGMNGSGSGGYRPKGRPVGQEMEDDGDSDSEGDAQNMMLISKCGAGEAQGTRCEEADHLLISSPRRRFWRKMILSLDGFRNGRPRGRTKDNHLAT